MTEKDDPIEVRIDENATSNPAGLEAWVLVNKKITERFPFFRGATPELIFDVLMEAGEILRMEKGNKSRGNLLIEAAYLVPGLNKEYIEEI